MTAARSITLTDAHPDWPRSIVTRLGASAPAQLQVIGPTQLLNSPRTALFCSASTPGSAILPAHDIARRLRDNGETVISGFHSDIEKQCLDILLRGKQPIILCAARSISNLRIPRHCRAAFDAGRLLILSPFTDSPGRVTRASATRRNEFVAALAGSIFVPHMEQGSQTERVASLARRWGIPVVQ